MAPFSKKKGRRLKLSLDRIGELLEKHPELGNLKVFLAADYSQIEVRMLAEISKDPLLIKMFRSGEDVHCLVGHEVTGWPVERIAKDKNARRFVKVCHFALVK